MRTTAHMFNPESGFMPSRAPHGPDKSRQVLITEPFRFEDKDRVEVLAPAGSRIDLDHGFIEFEDGGGTTRKIGLQLLPSQFFTPAELVGWLGGYPFPEYRAEEACQDIPVDRETFLYRNFDETYAFVPVTTRADNESEANQVSGTSATATDTVVYHRLSTFVPRVAQAHSPYDIAGVNGRLVMRLMRLNKELEILGSTGILPSMSGWSSGHAVALGANYQWGGASGIGNLSQPIDDLWNLVDKTPRGGRELDWWINGNTCRLMLQHPIIQEWAKFNLGNANPTPEELNMLKSGRKAVDFNLKGLGNFHTCTGQYMPTVSSALQYIMPEGVVAVLPYPGQPTNGMELATAYTWQLKWPGTGTQWNIREIQVETRGAGGLLIIVETARKAKKVGLIAGGYISAVSQ